MKATISALLAALAVAGCNTATPASRANTGRYDSAVCLEYCTNCTVSIQQQILSSADGEGDLTANPTQTASPRTDTALDLNLTKTKGAAAAAKAAADAACPDGACSDK